MKYSAIGKTEIKVSQLCLGSMTWGQQNSEEEAHEQIDYALDRGINFIDTAELYAVPSSPESQGLTEKYIGTWLAKNKEKRKDLILGSKVAGPSKNLAYMSELEIGFSKDRIHEAIDNSLARLQTDYIDIYHLHWPERGSNMFGQRDYVHDTQWEDNFEEVLETLDGLKQAGKLRHYALSNETAWGVMKTAMHADAHGYDRFMAIQNPYNLLNRTYEINLSEVSIREQIPLLAYSPLAMGVLTGKYHADEPDPDARLIRFEHKFPRYKSSHILEVASKYLAIAKKNELDMTQMALAFVNQKSFVASTIFGARTMEQLKKNIDAINISLSDEVLSEIDQVHAKFPNPAP